MALTQVKTLGIADDAVTIDKMAGGTDGRIITYDASGNPTTIGPGTDGQVLTSTGAGSPPAFEDVPAGGATINNATANELVTVASTTTQLDAEANLTFDGHHLTQNIDANAEGFNQTAAGAHYIDNTAEANLSSGNNPILRTTATWNGTMVAMMKLNAGADTTNKDDGSISFLTSAADDLSERVRITSSGTVGIGETAPLGQLHVKTGDSGQGTLVNHGDDFCVEGSGDSGITILSGNTADGSLIFGDDGDADIGRVVYNHNSNFMGFDVSAASRMKIKGDGDVEIADGDLVISTAGHGIDFSANTASSASGTSTANELLDHYEEGTWTPEFLSSWPAGGTNKGTYVRVGSIVTATGWIVGSTTGRTGNANAAVKNLPFALSYNGNSNRACAAIGYTKGINLTGSNLQLVTTVSQNATQFALYLIEDNASASVTKEQDMTGTVQFEFSITYTVH